MKQEYKTIIEIITGGLGLFVLYKSGVLSIESCVLAGLILMAIMACFQNLRQEFVDEIKKIKDEFKKLRTEELNPIRNALAEIQKFLREKFNFSPLHNIGSADKYGKSNSPMSPNDEGQRLLKESGFNNSYPLLKEKIFSALDDMKTRTLYDAEENAKDALDKLSSDPLFDDMKHYAVNHHKEPLETIFMVASWVIREDYGKEKNIKK